VTTPGLAVHGAGSADPAPSSPGPAGRAGRASRWLAFAVPALAELGVGGYRLGGPSLWRDEGYTLEVATRPVGAIVAMARHQDAVHGLYYVIMHFVVAALGTSPAALRLPSLLATSVAAGLTGVLALRLGQGTRLPAPPVVGALAGLLYAGLPLTTWYAQDARPYGLASLCAVAASWLLVRATGSRSWWWWAVYAAIIGLLGWLDVFALLLVPAHGLGLLWTRRSRRQSSAGLRWLAAAAAGLVLAGPLVLAGASQSSQLDWIARPSIGVVFGLIADLGGTKVLALAIAALALLCLVMEHGRERGGSDHSGDGWTTSALAVPWLVLPPAVLLTVSLAEPVYAERYVVFCLPAVALLAAAGLAWLARLATPAGATARRALLGALPSCAIVVVAVALLAGPQLTVRQTSMRPDDLKAVAAVVRAAERPGDAIVYLPWDSRVVGMAYPGPFAHLQNIGQDASPEATDSLIGRPVPLRVLMTRLSAAPRAWVVQWSTGAEPLPHRYDRERYVILHRLRLLRSWHIGSVLLGLYRPRAG
jgi:mannosyltransferase